MWGEGEKYPEGHSPLPDTDSLQFGYVLPIVMMQAGSLMVWEDLRYSTIEPSLRKGINQMAGISEEVKKVEMRWGDER